MNKKTSDFINKSKKIHINKFGRPKYGYSLVHYVGSKTKVEIFCKKCNKSFFQTPNNHLKGYGCYECGINVSAKSRKMQKKEFVNLAKKIHVNENGMAKYDYRNINYTNKQIPVLIRCKFHNIFFH